MLTLLVPYGVGVFPPFLDAAGPGPPGVSFPLSPKLLFPPEYACTMLLGASLNGGKGFFTTRLHADYLEPRSRHRSGRLS